MKNAARLLLPLLASLIVRLEITAPAAAVVAAPVATSYSEMAVVVPQERPETTSVTGGTEDQQNLVTWALEQYESAGLDLPILQIHLHSGTSPCKGNSGLFSSGSSPWRITLCTDERMVFLHEIGHAWSDFNLTETERAEFVEQRGMESWNDPETSWRYRGSEDAANTLAWGLVEDPIDGMLPDGPLAQKNQAFRLLTGIDSPRIVTGSM